MLSGQSCFGTALSPFTSAPQLRQVRKLNIFGTTIGLSIFCAWTVGLADNHQRRSRLRLP